MAARFEPLEYTLNGVKDFADDSHLPGVRWKAGLAVMSDSRILAGRFGFFQIGDNVRPIREISCRFTFVFDVATTSRVEKRAEYDQGWPIGTSSMEIPLKLLGFPEDAEVKFAHADISVFGVKWAV